MILLLGLWLFELIALCQVSKGFRPLETLEYQGFLIPYCICLNIGLFDLEIFINSLGCR